MEAVPCHVGVSLNAFDAAALLFLTFEDYLEVVGISDADGAIVVAQDEGGRVLDERVVQEGDELGVLYLSLFGRGFQALGGDREVVGSNEFFGLVVDVGHVDGSAEAGTTKIVVSQRLAGFYDRIIIDRLLLPVIFFSEHVHSII